MDDDKKEGGMSSKNEQFGSGWERDPNRINPHLQVILHDVCQQLFFQPGDVGRPDWGAGGSKEPGLHLELFKDLLPGESWSSHLIFVPGHICTWSSHLIFVADTP